MTLLYQGSKGKTQVLDSTHVYLTGRGGRTNNTYNKRRATASEVSPVTPTSSSRPATTRPPSRQVAGVLLPHGTTLVESRASLADTRSTGVGESSSDKLLRARSLERVIRMTSCRWTSVEWRAWPGGRHAHMHARVQNNPRQLISDDPNGQEQHGGAT